MLTPDIEDFELALRLCYNYARRLSTNGITDPDWLPCRNLCVRHGLSFEQFDKTPHNTPYQLSIYDYL